LRSPDNPNQQYCCPECAVDAKADRKAAKEAAEEAAVIAAKEAAEKEWAKYHPGKAARKKKAAEIASRQGKIFPNDEEYCLTDHPA
jgi:hypothetical protein